MAVHCMLCSVGLMLHSIRHITITRLILNGIWLTVGVDINAVQYLPRYFSCEWEVCIFCFITRVITCEKSWSKRALLEGKIMKNVIIIKSEKKSVYVILPSMDFYFCFFD